MAMTSSIMTKAFATGETARARPAMMAFNAFSRPKTRTTRKARIARRMEAGTLSGPSAARERSTTCINIMIL